MDIECFERTQHSILLHGSVNRNFLPTCSTFLISLYGQNIIILAQVLENLMTV